MTYEQWNALSEAIAVETILSGAADQMIPNEEMRPRIAHWKAVGDQRWHAAFRNAGDALIALEKLGYRVEKPFTGTYADITEQPL